MNSTCTCVPRQACRELTGKVHSITEWERRGGGGKFNSMLRYFYFALEATQLRKMGNSDMNDIRVRRSKPYIFLNSRRDVFSTQNLNAFSFSFDNDWQRVVFLERYGRIAFE